MDFYTITVSIVLSFIYVTRAQPQLPEINDQYEPQKHFEAETVKEDTITSSSTTNIIKTTSSTVNIDGVKLEQTTKEVKNENQKINNENQKDGLNFTPIIVRRSLVTKLYESITTPISTFISAPKVNSVIKNIGTCIVNGVMELISFYLPAPLIPLVASAAGMFIPFEPVVLLKQKMPVTSYRRAFRTAMDSFMGTFNNYKVQDEDPYMTQRFNRRFMGNSKEVKENKDLKEN